jgi:exonuclease III
MKYTEVTGTQVFSRAYTSSITEVQTINGQTSKIKVINGQQTELIEVYAPQEGSSDLETKEFLTELDKVATGEEVCIMGDFNVRVWEDGEYENVMVTNGTEEEILKEKMY